MAPEKDLENKICQIMNYLKMVNTSIKKSIFKAITENLHLNEQGMPTIIETLKDGENRRETI